MGAHPEETCSVKRRPTWSVWSVIRTDVPSYVYSYICIIIVYIIVISVIRYDNPIFIRKSCIRRLDLGWDRLTYLVAWTTLVKKDKSIPYCLKIVKFLKSANLCCNSVRRPTPSTIIWELVYLVNPVSGYICYSGSHRLMLLSSNFRGLSGLSSPTVWGRPYQPTPYMRETTFTDCSI